ncbi:MAG: hypothetical protein ACRDSZ_01080 [Pseudonocardiaceae bacterium]
MGLVESPSDLVRRASRRCELLIPKQTRPVQAAIDTIGEHDWVPIAYPHAIYDETTGQWIWDAESAETTDTAFRSRPTSEQITLRLIVWRVKGQERGGRPG